MTGHGWVTPLPNGTRARCGGPGLCKLCSVEAAQSLRSKDERIAELQDKLSQAINDSYNPHWELREQLAERDALIREAYSFVNAYNELCPVVLPQALSWLAKAKGVVG